LENRWLMSNSVSLNNGLLTLAGDATAGSNITVTLTNNHASISANANGHLLLVATSAVKQIQITGGSGNDNVYIDTGITVPATINGGDGNDGIRGGGGYNVITDGNGNDWVSGRGTADSITVGNGNDTVLGGGGNDTITAGSGNDSLVGAAGNDLLVAGNGIDFLEGDAGNDTLTAGNGADTLNGGAGNDQMTVGTGQSTLIPDTGTNKIIAGNPGDTIVPSSGTNSVTFIGTTNIPTNPAGSIATTPGWVSYSATAASGTNPVAVMQVLSSPPVVGIAVDTRALNSTLGSGSPIDANYQWNFGDPSSEYNTLDGFNASHVYTSAGTYAVTLTVTNNLNQSSTVKTNVVVSADTRRAIYVDSVNGSDKNSGLTPALAVQSAARAAQLLGNNTEVFFDRGETFNVNSPIVLGYTNVLIGAYGSGTAPLMNYTAPAIGAEIFSTNIPTANGVTIEDLAFTTLNGSNPTVANQPMAVMAGGYDTSVLRCTFYFVEYDVNGSGSPVGLNVIDNTSPLVNGLEGYMVWNQGTDTTILGNTAVGSVHEHICRSIGANEMLFFDNNFTNSDGKGCIEVQWGSYAWVDGNTVTGGDIRVGPLGLWGEPITSSTDDCVIQNNLVTNSFISVRPGAHSISIRNNVITGNAADLITVIGQDGLGRQSSDIRILDNTGINPNTVGNFLYVQNHTVGILLENNLYYAPNLATGGYGTAPVYVNETDLSSFTAINGNVWDMPGTIYNFANGGINFVGVAYTSSGYLTPAQWNSQSVVGTDFFLRFSFNLSASAPLSGSAVAAIDTPIAGVYGDFNGNSRPSSGLWTAGAVQL
jgi:hypothetical protein